MNSRASVERTISGCITSSADIGVAVTTITVKPPKPPPLGGGAGGGGGDIIIGVCVGARVGVGCGVCVGVGVGVGVGGGAQVGPLESSMPSSHVWNASPRGAQSPPVFSSKKNSTRLVRFVKLCGISPRNALSLRCSRWSLSRSPNCVGRSPDSPLLASDSCVTRPSKSVVTPYHSPRGRLLPQFVSSSQPAPFVPL